MSYDFNHMIPKQPAHLMPLKDLLPAGLLSQCQVTVAHKGRRLFEAGQKPQWMFFVLSGEVTLERLSEHGDTVVLQRTRRGFVSEASLQSSKYHCDAHVVANADIVQIPLPKLAKALAQDTEFAARWIRMLNQEVKRLRLQCERLSIKSVKDRLLHLLHTEGSNGIYTVNSGLKSLAGELGVTHEALYRTLATLEKDKLIKRDEGLLSLIAPH
jgi:CRP-like cAMP-binding protein